MKIRVVRGSAFVIALFAIFFMSSQSVYAQFGIAAGLNFDDFSDLNFRDVQGSVDNATGYHFGVFFDLAAGPLAIRPGVFYREVGDINYDYDFPNVDVDQTFDLSLVEVPIDVRFRLPAPLITPYLLAGPVFAFASSTNDDFDESLKDLSVAANIGVGVELGLPGVGIRLFPEIRYSFGITSMVDDFEFLGANISPEEDNQNLNVLMVRLGLAF